MSPSSSVSAETAASAVPESHVAAASTFRLDYIITPVVASAVIVAFSLFVTLTVALTVIVVFIRFVINSTLYMLAV